MSYVGVLRDPPRAQLIAAVSPASSSGAGVRMGGVMLLVVGGESVDHASNRVLWDKIGCIVTRVRDVHGGGGALYEQVLHVGRGGGVGVQAGGAGERRGLLETVTRRGRRVRVLSTQGG